MAATHRAVARHVCCVARNAGGIGPYRHRLSVVTLSRCQQRHASSSSSRIPVSNRPSRVLPRSLPSRHASDPHIHKGETSKIDQIDSQENVKASNRPPIQDARQESKSSSVIPTKEEEEESSNNLSIPSTIEDILGQNTLIVTREVEMMNIFLGFEQANKYALKTAQGNSVGYLAESEKGMLGGSIQRQILRTHRPFEAQILDTCGNVMMTIKRSFTLINSKIRIYSLDSSTKEELLVGEVHQIFHIYRRKYELFINRGGGEKESEELEQFAEIDEGLFAWDFILKNDNGRPLGAISRNFRGFGREIFTDTGQYVVTFDPTTLKLNPQIEQQQQQEDNEGKKDASLSNSSSGKELITSGPVRALSIQERAVALATAISADFDYFSRHSHGSTGGMMPWLWMGGGGTKEAEPVLSQDSSGVEAPPPTPGSDGGLGPNVGTGATYETFGGQSQPADQAPPSQQTGDYGQGQEDVWGKEDPWGDASPGEEVKSGWGWGNDDAGGGDCGGGGSWFDGFFDN